VKKTLARFIRWTVTAAIIVFLVVYARTIDWSAAWQSIRGASMPLLLAAVVVNFLSIAIKGLRWWLFLRPAGIESLGLSFRATIAGSGLNNILLANGGDAARVLFVARKTGARSSTVLATLALERLFDPVGFVILLVWGAILYDLPASLEKWTLAAELTLGAVLVLLVWFVWSSRHAVDLPAESIHEESGFIARARRYLSGFASSTRSLTTGPRFFWALVISMISWIAQLATFQLAAMAAHVTIPQAGNLAALLTTNLGLLIRATPGNLGFFQFVYALSVGQFGVGRNAAIAISLLIQIIQIVPVTIIGILLAPEFIFGQKPVRRDASAIAHEHEPVLLGRVAEESEKLERAARQP
jgi:uncharacterized protein (TIRG00374 family)